MIPACCRLRPSRSKQTPCSAYGGAVPRAAATLALTALVGMSALAVVTASPQQAPNSRVVLDLPPGYVPSPLFSGFQNDTSGVSFIILEAPVGEYDKMAHGFTAEELAKRGITDVQKAGSRAPTRTSTCARTRNRPPARMPSSSSSSVPPIRRSSSRSTSRNAHSRMAASSRPISNACWPARRRRKSRGARPLFALLSRALQGGGHAGRHQQGLHARRAAGAGARRRDALGVHGGALARQAAGDQPEKQSVALLASLPGYKDFKPGKPHSRSTSAGSTASRSKPRRWTPTMASRSTSIRRCCSARTAAISA